MSRTKLFMISMLAVAAMSMAGSSSAFATHEFIVNGSTIAKGETVGYGGNQLQWQPQFEIRIPPTQFHIQCQLWLLPFGTKNVLEEGGKFKIFIEVKGCSITSVTSSGGVENQPKCKVANITAEGSGELSEAGVLSASGTGAEKTFTEFKIEEVTGAGACLISGTYKAKGTQTCPIWHWGYSSYIVNINCNGSGSKELTFDNEPAKLNLQGGITGSKGQTFRSN